VGKPFDREELACDWYLSIREVNTSEQFRSSACEYQRTSKLCEDCSETFLDV